MTNPKNSNANDHSIDHYEGDWMIFVLLFMVFMVVAMVGQLLVLNWRNWLPGAEQSMNTVDGVKSSVYTVISHLC